MHRKITGYDRWVRNQFHEIAKKEATPHEVALGFSVGLFAGLATPGFDVLAALLLALVFKLHKLAVFIGVALINPITTIFIYPVSLKIGAMFIGYNRLQDVSFFSLENLLNLSKPLLLGNLILATALAIVSYALVYALYYYGHYKSIEKKRLEAKEQPEDGLAKN